MNRVEKRFSLIGYQKSLLSRAFSEPSLPVEADASIPQLLRARLLVETEPGQVSLSHHLRAVAEDGADRNVRFEAPDDFHRVIDILVAQSIDYASKAMRSADTREVEVQFRTKCAELHERISRGLMIFQEQVENIDIQSMTAEEAERHFGFYGTQMSGYVLALGDLSHGRLMDALEPLIVEPLLRIFRRIIAVNRDEWIDRVIYLQRLIEKSLFKLRQTTLSARRLRAVVAHMRRYPDFVIADPSGAAPDWMRMSAGLPFKPAIDWSGEGVRQIGVTILSTIKAQSLLRPARSERKPGKMVLDDTPPEPRELPPLLKAIDEWVEVAGPRGLSALDYHRASQHTQDIPVRLWLLALYLQYQDNPQIVWDLRKSVPHTDDQCLSNARFSTVAT